MNRREILKASTLMLGYAVTAGTAMAVMNGCKADRSITWTPSFLDPDKSLMVEDISELIIPQTDTPGAKEAMVGRFIDEMLGAWNLEDRQKFILGLDAFNDKAMSEYKKAFTKCNQEQQGEVLDILAKDSMGKREHIFKTLRELTVVGYCSSEVGATALLTYDPVPGPFQGCIDFSEVGSTYAL